MQSSGASLALGCQAAGCCTPGQCQPFAVTEVPASQLLLTDVSHFQCIRHRLWLCVNTQCREWWTWVWAFAHLWNGVGVPNAPDSFRREAVGEDPYPDLRYSPGSRKENTRCHVCLPSPLLCSIPRRTSRHWKMLLWPALPPENFFGVSQTPSYSRPSASLGLPFQLGQKRRNTIWINCQIEKFYARGNSSIHPLSLIFMHENNKSHSSETASWVDLASPYLRSFSLNHFPTPLPGIPWPMVPENTACAF